MSEAIKLFRVRDIYRLGAFIKNLIKFILNRKIKPTPINSMTLDYEDVNIAKSFLKNPKDWHNVNIIRQFEEKFKQVNESKFAFSFMGGRVALSACIYALGLKEGDKVLIPAYTCVVVPNAFWYERIKVEFYDIELDTFGPDIDDLKKKISKS